MRADARLASGLMRAILASASTALGPGAWPEPEQVTGCGSFSGAEARALNPSGFAMRANARRASERLCAIPAATRR
ncbi:hypothetical protein E3T54_08205 [Cryobacterium sp. Sr8]|uniref:hypothetical protein n=1 Tax=Cryobacterium sp. Sr8 TaxID=1259203 RepID=UPI00106C8538|nr:hypothetical protein [Cryobacterium sp. Sr8]TFD77588.1 hypothetical protein E3T54_08205 [Cryobacterium sp. Sr8]